jgi:hypothetical protein
VQELISASADGLWSIGEMSNRYIAAGSSQLAYYGRQCSNCLDVNIIIYEDTSNALQMAQLLSNGWSQTPIGSDLPTPVNGSSLSIIPFSWFPDAWVLLYINTGKLEELYFNGSNWISASK